MPVAVSPADCRQRPRARRRTGQTTGADAGRVPCATGGAARGRGAPGERGRAARSRPCLLVDRGRGGPLHRVLSTGEGFAGRERRCRRPGEVEGAGRRPGADDRGCGRIPGGAARPVARAPAGRRDPLAARVPRGARAGMVGPRSRPDCRAAGRFCSPACWARPRSPSSHARWCSGSWRWRSSSWPSGCTGRCGRASWRSSSRRGCRSARGNGPCGWPTRRRRPKTETLPGPSIVPTGRGSRFSRCSASGRPTARARRVSTLRLLPDGSGHAPALVALTRTFEPVWYGRQAADARTFSHALSSLEDSGCRCS